VLLELEIEHFALIESARLLFGEGLNVLSGETGAGKSIVLDALGFLLGDPVPNNPMRGETRVCGRFLLSAEAHEWLLGQGWEREEEAVILRQVSAGGRSICRLNGRMCSLGQLRELGHLMMEIHSQHQSNSLLRPSRHLELLDRLAGPEHQQLLEAYRQTYRESQQLHLELDQIVEAERERHRQLEWLRFEIGEIEQAYLVPGQEDDLEERIRRLSSSQEIGQRVRQALDQLSGDALEALGVATKQLMAVQRIDAGAGAFGEQLASLESQLQELIHQLLGYQEQLNVEPAELDALLRRADQLKGLKRKYGPDVESILQYAQEAQSKLEILENIEEHRSQLEAQRVVLLQRLDAESQALSQSRQVQARRLEAEVALQLADLNLANMRFEVHQAAQECGPQGRDALEFFLAPNPGTPSKPLAKIASGGELSRIMLAIIGIFAKFEPLSTLILDEIDAGLGGRAAEAVARKLKLLGQDRQVLCVTHLAVIAAAAQNHVLVQKNSDGQTTQLTLKALQGKQREAEIARMLSGDAGATKSLGLARELLRRGESPSDLQNR
jgi:DNA repair protein RecN (Recombination protein N)